MTDDLRNPEFWLALAVGLVSLGFFIRWLHTGGRKSARQPVATMPDRNKTVGASRSSPGG
jgi:hypothetical protein